MYPVASWNLNVHWFLRWLSLPAVNGNHSPLSRGVSTTELGPTWTTSICYTNKARDTNQSRSVLRGCAMEPLLLSIWTFTGASTSFPWLFLSNIITFLQLLITKGLSTQLTGLIRICISRWVNQSTTTTSSITVRFPLITCVILLPNYLSSVKSM